MALPVLDGNQSATTLSSVVTGGEHIVAHSVVSLGTTAISNINSAVSGSAVTIPGLARLSNSIASDGTADANLDFIKIGGHQDGQNQVAHIVHVSAGGAMKVDASGSSVTFSQAPVTFGAITGSASILNFPSTQTIAGTVTANLGGYSQTAVSYSGSSVTAIPVALQTNGVYGGTLLAYNGANTYLRVGLDAVGGNSLAFGGSVPISGTVTVGNSVTIGSIPAISGTVTIGNSVTIGSLPAISGTVTANMFGFDCVNNEYSPIPVLPYNEPIDCGNTVIARLTDISGTDLNLANGVPISGTVTVGNTVTIGSLPAISGTVTANVDALLGDTTFTDSANVKTLRVLPHYFDVNTNENLTVDNDTHPLPISGTVTAAAPNGSLTTRFGTPTTANVSFATSAVTNANRKYLLIQNVTTGSNVITVGIGFTPTTTQGIQLTAGAGITFESSYIPTGAVYVLSSVTASNFTILEA